MAASPPFLPQTHADIRSASLPRQRLASKRAKYGGPSPDTVDFHHTVAVSDSAYDPSRGFVPTSGATCSKSPPKLLSKAQKYRFAHHNVGSLIGKRVNRNNQRTHERDPWNYYGAGRRWDKAAASGKNMTMDEYLEDVSMQDLTEADIQDDYLMGWLPATWEEALKPEPGSEDIWGRMDSEGLRVVDAKVRGRRWTSEREWEVVGDVQRGWMKAGKGEGEGDDDDDWDVVSLSSTLD